MEGLHLCWHVKMDLQLQSKWCWNTLDPKVLILTPKTLVEWQRSWWLVKQIIIYLLMLSSWLSHYKHKSLIFYTSRPRAGFAPHNQCLISDLQYIQNASLQFPELISNFFSTSKNLSILEFQSHFELICFLRISRELDTQSVPRCAHNTPRANSFLWVCHLPIWFAWFLSY